MLEKQLEKSEKEFTILKKKYQLLTENLCVSFFQFLILPLK